MPPTPTGRSRHLDAIAPAVRALVQRRIDERNRRRPDTGQAVDKMLADLDAAAGGKCSCGCGTSITPSSPSAYYASAGCQQAWMARHVDNPHEVYRRGDAAAYPRADSGVQTLSEPASARPARRADHVSARPNHVPGLRRRHLIYGPGRLIPLLAYERNCPACDDFMAPRIYSVDEDIDFDGTDRRSVFRPVELWEQECSSCDATLCGTVHVPVVYPAEEPEGWTLELHTAYGRVRSTVTTLALDRATSPGAGQAFIAETWASMERDLARFEREWRGRLGRAEAAMAEWTAGPPPPVVGAHERAVLAAYLNRFLT